MKRKQPSVIIESVWAFDPSHATLIRLDIIDVVPWMADELLVRVRLPSIVTPRKRAKAKR
jgi:hypothetical protein